MAFNGRTVCRIFFHSSLCHHIGDRPIEITLQRAWQALTWPQRLRLLGLLLRGGFADTSELNMNAVEALKNDDVITSVVAEYSQKFPQVTLIELFYENMFGETGCKASIRQQLVTWTSRSDALIKR